MASELRVNTLKDASGNNSVATSTVAEGTVKMWINMNGTGTPAARDSFNVSSITDNGTGDQTVNYTNSFGTVNYAVTHYTAYQGTGQLHNNRMTGSSNKATGSIRVATGYVSSTVGDIGAEDVAENNYANWGDLA